MKNKNLSRSKIVCLVLKYVGYVATAIAMTALVGILVYILVSGIPHLSPSLFGDGKDGPTILPALVGTLSLVVISLAIAVPIGMFAAIFLAEYTNNKSKLVRVIRIATETLAGIPSIVYGLFGYLVFVVALKMGYSLLGGGITLSLMILPVIVRSVEESLLSVPAGIREGSYALGAGKVRTIFKAVLPSCAGGIVTAIILAVGRVVSESAVLLLTVGMVVNKVPASLLSPGTTLALDIYYFASFGYANEAAATGVVLIVLVLGINMLAALAVILLCVDEPKLVAEQRRYEDAHPEDNLTQVTENGETLPKDVKRSLGFLLASIALWFIGYNGVTTWFSVYAGRTWHMTLAQANTCLTIATAGAILSYIPVGNVASRVGRRKTIRFGTLLLAGSFFAAFIYTMMSDSFSPVLYGLFVLVGMAWAAINVNSLPMVVEMCSGSEVGKFTGLYYTFSMSAQIITPIVAGWLLRNVSYRALFPYAAFFVFASFLTMGFVRHGDNKVPAKKGLEAYDVED